MRYRISKPIVRALEDALLHVSTEHLRRRSALAPGSMNGLSPEDFDRVSLYFETWAHQPLALALRAIKGETEVGDDLYLADHYGGRI